jgi:anti-sigma regulatory factor (Ser/Thr protein kinase)
VADRAIGGLGLKIVKNVLDRLDYRRADGVNRITMEMKLKAA